MKQRKILSIFIAVLCFGFLFVGKGHDASATSTQTGFVKASKQAIVYSTYNKNSKVIGKISEGEKLTSVKVHSENWYYVQYKNIKGYVSVGEVILDKKPNSYNGVGKLTSSVKSYVSADQRSKSVRIIKSGTSVDIIGIVGKWYQIKIGNSIEYITNQNIKVDANEGVSKYTAKGTVQSTTNAIHVPNQYGKVLATYTAGASVEIVGKTKNFYKIKYNSNYAYILSSRIKIEPVSSYSDNASRLYYELSSLAYGHYNASTIEGKLNKTFSPANYKVIDTIDLSKTSKHPMALSSSDNYYKELKESGFQAFAAVNTKTNRLYIAFAGSEAMCNYLKERTKCDLVQVGAKILDKVPTQAYDAHLYVNYIYDKFPKYRDYNWYLTGHSYGGYLATKVFLDAESTKVLNPTSRDLVHAGMIRKKIQGVYTFNTVTMHKNHFAQNQQTLNTKGTYNKYVYNLVYDDELVNYYQKKSKSTMIYVGTTQIVKKEGEDLSLIGKHDLKNMKQFTK